MFSKVDHGDGELASSTIWLPSVQASPLLQDNLATSISKSSLSLTSSSRALRPGDWRLVAAAETGGGPVQPPTSDLQFSLDSTPNIDDVHSPASSVPNCDSASSPIYSRSVSPLWPRVLATSSAPRAVRGETAGNPVQVAIAASPEANSGSSTPVRSLGGGEASFRLDSPPRNSMWPPGDLSPSNYSPCFAPARAASDGELSTPGSDGYTSPSMQFVVRSASIMRSNVHNPLFVDRPTPSDGDNAIAKTLVLSPCVDGSLNTRLPRRTQESGWSSASNSGARSLSLTPEDRRADQLDPSPITATMPPPASSAVTPHLSCEQGPPSGLLPKFDLETPRRSIKGLSAMLSNAVSGGDASSGGLSLRGSQASTPCSYINGCVPSHPAGAGGANGPAAATPCSAAVVMHVAVNGPPACGLSVDKSGAAPTATAIYPDTASSPQAATVPPSFVSDVDARMLNIDSDDTGGPGRGLDQTLRKAGKGALCTGGARETGKHDDAGKRRRDSRHKRGQQGAVQHDDAVEGRVQGGKRRVVPTGNAVQAMAAWALFVMVATISTYSIVNKSPRPEHLAISKMGPVCFPDRYPVAQRPKNDALAHTSVLMTVLSSNGYTSDFKSMTSTRVPFCWSAAPTCHFLDGMLSAHGHLFAVADTVSMLEKPFAAVLAAAVVETLESFDHQTPALDQPLKSVGDAAATALDHVSEVVEDFLEQPQSPVDGASAVANVLLESLSSALDATEGLLALTSTASHESLLELVESLTGQGAVETNFAQMYPSDTDINVPPQPCQLEAATAAEQPTSMDGATQHLPVDDPIVHELPLVELGYQTPLVLQREVMVASVSDPVAESYNDEEEYTPANKAAASSAAVGSRTDSNSFFSLRMFGWSVSELIIGSIAACFAGAFLALGVERYSDHLTRRSAAIAPPDLPPPAHVTQLTRILKVRATHRGDAPLSEPKLDARPIEAPQSVGAQRDGTGSYVWMRGRLVYVEE